MLASKIAGRNFAPMGARKNPEYFAARAAAVSTSTICMYVCMYACMVGYTKSHNVAKIIKIKATKAVDSTYYY